MSRSEESSSCFGSASVGTSSSSSSSSGMTAAAARPIQQRTSGRVRTRCRDCANRRVRCDAGPLVSPIDPTTPAKRSPCSNCTRRSKICQYPDGNDGWYDAFGQEESGLLEASQSQPSSDSARPRQRPGPFSASSSSSLSGSAEGAPSPATTAMVAYQPQLSQRARIPLFEAAKLDNHDSQLLTYLFSSQITASLGVPNSDPQQNHFQRSMLPFIYYTLAANQLGANPEGDLVFHSAMALSAFHSATFNASTNAVEPAMQHVQKAQTSLGIIRSSLGDSKSDTSLMGIHLLSVAHSFGGLEITLHPDDLAAVLTSPLGHDILDILCLFSTIDALIEVTSTRHPVPAAGSREIEATFGVARPMWHLYSRLTALIARKCGIHTMAMIIELPTFEQECTQMMQDSISILTKIEGARSTRICLGTKAFHHALAILLHVEVLGNSAYDFTAQQHCELVLQTCMGIEHKERNVGLTLPLTIAACYCINPTQKMQFIDLLHSIQVGQQSQSIGPSIPELYLAINSVVDAASTVMPWRDAWLTTSGFSLL